MIMSPKQLDWGHAEHIFSGSPRARATAASRNTNERLGCQQLKLKAMRCSHIFTSFLFIFFGGGGVFYMLCTKFRSMKHAVMLEDTKTQPVQSELNLWPQLSYYSLKGLTLHISGFISLINICDNMLKEEMGLAQIGLSILSVAQWLHTWTYDPNRSVWVFTSKQV